MSRERGTISILIAKSSAMNGELLAAALMRQSQFSVVARAATTQDVLELADSKDADVALITVTLQDGPLSGIGAVRQLRERGSNTKAVVLVDSPEPTLVIDAFRAGAKGVFCPSQSEFKMLCKCVECVSQGQIWASSTELGHVMEAFAQLAPLRVVTADGLKLLSKREEDVVRLLAEGLSNRDIARELKLSEHTIKNYLFRIFDKVGVSSRVELVLYALSSTKRVQMAGMEAGVDNKGQWDRKAAANSAG